MNSPKKVLFIGYGIDKKRKEAVSINTLKLMETLSSLGIKNELINIGYKEHKAQLSIELSMKGALLKHKLIQNKLKQYISLHQFTHVHDLFVLPGASSFFTIPLIKSFPNVIFIKEIHNDYGYSHKAHSETILRFIFNSKYYFNKTVNSFNKIVTRNFYLSKKYNFIYLPVGIKSQKLQKHSFNNTISICYLGHPLYKKGVFEFLQLMDELPQHLKSKIRFNFAFSNIGSRHKLESLLRQKANKNNISVNFFGLVKPQAFFEKNDIFILPLHDEFGSVSTPNTVLEAMNAGTLVIVTKVRTLEGILKDKENGIFLSTPNAKNIVKSIEYLLSNVNKWNQMRDNAEKTVRENFSEQRLIEEIKYFYD